MLRLAKQFARGGGLDDAAGIHDLHAIAEAGDDREIEAGSDFHAVFEHGIDAIEDQLADPALYEKDPVGATRLAKERSDLTGQLSRNEEKWLEMSAEYEEGIAE